MSLLGASAVDITPSTTGTPIPDCGYVPQGRAKGQFADITEQATGRHRRGHRAGAATCGSGKGTVGKLMTDDRLYAELQQFVGDRRRR